MRRMTRGRDRALRSSTPALGVLLLVLAFGCSGAGAPSVLRAHAMGGEALVPASPLSVAATTPAATGVAPLVPQAVPPTGTARPSPSLASSATPTTPAGRTRSPVDSPLGLPGEPDPALTPGAANPTVTQSSIRSTICVSGWTATVRPPSSYTTALKRSQITAYGYADTNLADYEEDHLIPLELGGAPRDPANLWPEPYSISLADGTAVGARVKDQLENGLHALVCGGTLSLTTAQRLIGSDWIGAWRTYVATGSVATPLPALRPTPTLSVGSSSPSAGTGPIKVAIASLTSPVSRGGTASLAARTAPGAACTINVVYKSGPSKAASLGPKTASSAGSVGWSWTVGTRTTPGSWPVSVTCTKGAASASATRSFVVQ